MNNQQTVTFKDGTAVPKENETIYLGGKINNKGHRKNDINARISKALNTVHKLKVFWKQTKCSELWKLRVYNAVVSSQLMYGLESHELTKSEQQKLDTFQLKGFRHILGINHAFWSAISNKEIYDEVERIADSVANPSEYLRSNS